MGYISAVTYYLLLLQLGSRRAVLQKLNSDWSGENAEFKSWIILLAGNLNSMYIMYNTIQYKICKGPCCRGFRGAGEQDS